MCDIDDVVRKITPVFNILNPFCPRLSGMVAHICHGKTYFLTAKLTFSRQNLLFHGKTYFLTAKLTFIHGKTYFSTGPESGMGNPE